MKNAINVALSFEAPRPPSGQFKRVSTACGTLVRDGQGAAIHAHLQDTMNRNFDKLREMLMEDDRVGVEWLQALNSACEWFGKQVVGFPDYRSLQEH